MVFSALFQFQNICLPAEHALSPNYQSAYKALSPNTKNCSIARSYLCRPSMQVNVGGGASVQFVPLTDLKRIVLPPNLISLKSVVRPCSYLHGELLFIMQRRVKNNNVPAASFPVQCDGLLLESQCLGSFHTY